MELVDDIDENRAGDKCGHFTIRGFVSEIRKEDGNRHWPFLTAKACNNSGTQSCDLPPMDVPVFGWWRCRNCVRTLLRKVTGKSNTEIVDLSNNVRENNQFNENPTTPSPGDTAMQLSQASGDDMEKMEALIEQPTGEGQGHDEYDTEENVCQIVYLATNDEPCQSGGTSCSAENAICVYSNMNEAHTHDASEKSVSHEENTLQTISLKGGHEKRKLKKVRSSSAGGTVHRKKLKRGLRKETSDCGTSIGNVGIYEKDNEFSENECDHLGGTSHRRKFRKIRSLKEILSVTTVVDGKSFVSSEDKSTHETSTEGALQEVRKTILEIDLNRSPDSPVAAERNSEELSLSKLEYRGNVPRLKASSSAFAGGSPSFLQPKDCSHQSFLAEKMREQFSSDEMEVVALLAKNRHERHVAEGANDFGTAGYFSHPSMLQPSRSNDPHSPVVCLESITSRERECEYHRNPATQLDLLANNNIPATELLKLMHAGACLTSSDNMQKRQKFIGQSMLPPKYNLPQLPRKDFEHSASGEASTHVPSWGFFHMNPNIQAFDYLKSQDKKIGKGKNAGREKPRNSRSKKSVARNANASEKLQIGERFQSLSTPKLFLNQTAGIEIPDRAIRSSFHAELDLNQTAGIEICSINRNPAEFTLPETGNEYMTGYRELKRKKRSLFGK